MKLFNYRCPKCGKEKDVLLTSEEQAEPWPIIPCETCGDGQYMEQFNLKNNSQVWKYNDK